MIPERVAASFRNGWRDDPGICTHPAASAPASFCPARTLYVIDARVHRGFGGGLPSDRPIRAYEVGRPAIAFAMCQHLVRIERRASAQPGSAGEAGAATGFRREPKAAPRLHWRVGRLVRPGCPAQMRQRCHGRRRLRCRDTPGGTVSGLVRALRAGRRPISRVVVAAVPPGSLARGAMARGVDLGADHGSEGDGQGQAVRAVRAAGLWRCGP